MKICIKYEVEIDENNVKTLINYARAIGSKFDNLPGLRPAGLFDRGESYCKLLNIEIIMPETMI